ncbi:MULTISPECIES: prolipoprotein diacylglyceryl transferase [Pseudanabaena]|uniref:prolipoprotein diacylglyceryl transferase n=1 Tax=Pseudanabaena TaxID=1152 RepID=UPI0024796BF9|nr:MULTISPECIES: prolipoprotein diacylglyceryl transferase [Pseudanabaena]MEA5487587.1 prolipoprotein diacylglyceryl transferase [Pseudanabaena sp. CCNP1317]WGS75362.1 prolipoprotein diacylglyceryl transferase [Pseudanabaena galeata CCNP1313]
MLNFLPFAFEFTSPGPIAFGIGSFSIRWYGMLIASAVVIGTLLAQKLAKKRGIDPDIVGNLVIWLVVGAIPCARLYYVLFEWQRFQNQPWYKAFAIWEGGIAIHGAIIGGAIVTIIFCQRQKISAWLMTDIVMPALILGQAIGRWGNFFNSEAFGRPTDLPWKLFIPVDRRPPEFASESYFHPTFLYESLWNVGVFAILMFLFFRFPKIRTGTLTMTYAIAYSLGRFWIEGLRTDSLMVGSLRTAQVISLVAIALGIFGLVWLYGLRRRFPDTVSPKVSQKNSHT